MKLYYPVIERLKKKFFQDRRFLVIEIGTCNLKAAYFSLEDKLCLKNFWTKEISGFSEEGLENTIKSFIKGKFTQYEIKKIKTFFILPQSLWSSKRISLPPLPAKEISSAVKFKLKDEIEINAETAVCRWMAVYDEGCEKTSKLDLFVSLIAREEIDKVAEMSKRIGVNVYGIYSLLFTLPGYIKFSRPDECAAVLDLGCRSTAFMIFKKNTPLFLRSIPFFSNQLSEALEETFREEGLSLAEAEALKRQYGITGGQEYVSDGITAQDLIASMRSSIEKLVEEIRRSFEYYSLEFENKPINKLYLLGGGALLKGLDLFLSKALNMEVSFLPFSEEIKIDENIKDKSSALAQAPVLASVVYARKNNFLPWEMRASEIEWIERFVLKVVGPFLFFIYFVLSVSLFLGGNVYQKQLKNAEMRMGVVEDIKRVKKNVMSKGRVEALLTKSYIPPDWVMKGISQILPPELTLIKVEFNKEKRKVSLEGYLLTEVNAENILAEYVKKLRELGIFEDANIADITRNSKEVNKKVNFQINCKTVL